MRSVTKNLLFVLITIMAYLPMTVTYALPDISVSEQSQSMSDMDMSKCHEQQSGNNCSHCSDLHNCNTSHSSCSTSSAITSPTYELNVNQEMLTTYLTIQVDTIFQQLIPLLRPPISL